MFLNYYWYVYILEIKRLRKYCSAEIHIHTEARIKKTATVIFSVRLLLVYSNTEAHTSEPSIIVVFGNTEVH